MLDALSGLAIIAIPIAVGYLAARLRLFAPGLGKQLNLLVFYVLIPCMVFGLLSRADPSVLFSPLSWTSFAAAVTVFAAYALVAGLAWRRGAAAVTVGALAAGYTNAGHIGLPVALYLLGDATLATPVILFQTGVFAPVGLALLETAGRAGADTARPPLWRLIGHALLNPIVVASLAGLAISLSGLRLPAVAGEAVDLIGNAAVPVVLIAFGLSLRGRVLLERGPARAEAVLAAALKLVAMPLAAWALGRFAFGLSGHDLYVVTTLAALPTALNVFNFASRYDQSTVLARDTISLTTLGAAPALLLVAALLG
jgi:predicted permease